MNSYSVDCLVDQDIFLSFPSAGISGLVPHAWLSGTPWKVSRNDEYVQDLCKTGLKKKNASA
jgi:hypothetical protein